MNPELKGDADQGYRLSGTLSYETVPRLFRSGPPEFDRSTSLDLADLERVDSAGLALLVEWTRVVRKQNRELELKNVPASLKVLINVTGLQEFLSVVSP